MKTNWGRAAVWAVTVPTAMAVLSGCGVIPGSHGSISMESGTAGPAVATSSPAAGGSDTPAASSTPTKSAGSTGSPAAKGCPAGGAAVPANANRALTVDLDGDKKKDTLWLADKGGSRVLGVETASGARMSTVFASGLPFSANAVGGMLGDGSAVILLDFSREAWLYGVIDCKIYGYENVQGKQYKFDEGFTGHGTGVGCPEIGTQGRRLVGYLAEPGGNGDGYKVTRTLINLDRKEIVATNGATESVAEGVPGSDTNVKRAEQIICGPGDRVTEPSS